MGNEILAIDLLQAARNPSEAILWRHNLVYAGPGVTTYQRQINVKSLQHPWGGQRRVYADMQQRLIGVTGPIQAQGVYYQKLRELVCVDPLTGETIWARDSLPQGADVFGDGELLFSLLPASKEAQVYSAIDGRELGTRAVDALDNRWATYGRNVLAWRQAEGQRPLELRLYDAWTGDEIWREQFVAGSKGTLVDDDEVAVLQPDGRFMVRTLYDDRTRVETTLEAEAQLDSLHVLRSSTQYLVAASRTITATSDGRTPGIRSISSGSYTPLILGRLYAFGRADGETLWQTPAAVDRHGLLLDQPAESPVLVFLRHVRPTSSRGTTREHTELLCLDRRDGRVLVDNIQIPAQTSMYEIQADRQASTVQIGLPGKTVTIKLTDQPMPPEPPAQTTSTAG
jgi:outer membrane protein assembly factor BamB